MTTFRIFTTNAIRLDLPTREYVSAPNRLAALRRFRDSGLPELSYYDVKETTWDVAIGRCSARPSTVMYVDANLALHGIYVWNEARKEVVHVATP